MGSGYFSPLQIIVESTSTSFPFEVVLGQEAEDLLVPVEQYGLLSGILEGADVMVSARLDK